MTDKASQVTPGDVDRLVENAVTELGRLLAPPMGHEDMVRAPGLAATLESLLRSRELLATPRAPEAQHLPPLAPNLKRETLGEQRDMPEGTGTSEMAANALMERLRRQMQRLPGVAEGWREDVLSLAEQLRALAASAPAGPARSEREQRLESVATAARAIQRGEPAAHQRLDDALRALDGVK